EIEVPVEMLVGRTLAELADWVDHTSLPTRFVARPDLDAAAVLDDPGFAVAAQRGGADGDVLLTGATGSLGAYLLCAPLARSGRCVICLGRARGADHARGRLRSTAQRLGLAPDLARVDVICGDLAAPRLGLTDAGLAALAARTWRIVHAGARVDWAAS